MTGPQVIPGQSCIQACDNNRDSESLWLALNLNLKASKTLGPGLGVSGTQMC